MKAVTPFLKVVPFHSLENWSVQYLNEHNVAYNDTYPLVPIGDFLKRVKLNIDILDGQEYKRVTIKINNGGVFLRDVEIGDNIGTKKQFLINQGQFLLSKIDARNGAFGVVPPEVDGAIITGNFWTFDVDYSKINPHFLSLITTTKHFLRFCQKASNGTTNRHYLQEDLFLQQQIPLPSLAEQNRILKSYNQRLASASKLRVKTEELVKESQDFLLETLAVKKRNTISLKSGLNFIPFSKLKVWGIEKLFKGSDESPLLSMKYENKPLGSVAFINPRTDLTGLKPNSEMSFIPMECVSDEFGEVSELRSGVRANSNGYTKFQEGDLIWARITPCMQNGKSTIVSGLTNGIGYGSTEFHVIRQGESGVRINYIYHLLRSLIVRKDATSHFTGSAGQQRVPKDYLENLFIPVPPIEIQEQIVRNLDQIKHQIKLLNKQIKQNELEAISDFENEIFS